MAERWASNIIEAIRDSSGGSAAQDSGIMTATIQSINPLSIKTHDTVISKNLYVNPCYILESERIAQLFQSAPAPPELFDFLKQYHDMAVLHIGDTVVVKQSGVSFYILSKVVRA